MPDQSRTIPRTDDFRFERDSDKLVLSFTPDGRSYTFLVEGDRLSEPTVSPSRANAADYADDVRRTVAESADPQIVSFAMEGARRAVESVSD
ncbi:hypothetical protein ACFOYU_05805 [Microvirga sp. GCM10011540]|uniref:hypothetical protein n=1 Tax=Microvirga sp. GCM10011540 TaxID=3317338 RepID=UPI00361C56F8